MFLPPEVLNIIFAILRDQSKPGLKQARLVNKAWAVQIPQYLFTDVFVADRYADMENAKNILANFGAFVTTLIYASEDFQDFSNFTEYAQHVNQRHPDGLDDKSRRPVCYDDHVRDSWDTYNNLSKEHDETAFEGRHIRQLCRTLQALPQISRVILAHSWRRQAKCWCMQAADDARRRSFKPWREAMVCLQDECKYQEYHRGKCITSHHYTGYHWRFMMEALNATTNNVREIIIRYEEDLGLSLPICVFDTRYDTCRFMEGVFPRLTSLNLSLNFSQSHRTDTEIGLREVMRTAVSLESLTFTVVDSGVLNGLTPTQFATLTTVLGGCAYPRLASLVLGGLPSTEDELLLFCKSLPNLRHLCLKNHSLTDGYWDIAVQKLRDDTDLTTMQLDSIKGALEYGILTSEGYHTVQMTPKVEKIMERFFLVEKGSDISAVAQDIMRVEKLLL